MEVIDTSNLGVKFVESKLDFLNILWIFLIFLYKLEIGEVFLG